MTELYAVLFYKNHYGAANVKLGGDYNTPDEAISRIYNLFGNIKSGYKNAVYSENGTYCGWINKIKIGDNNYFGLNINQQSDSIPIINS